MNAAHGQIESRIMSRLRPTSDMYTTVMACISVHNSVSRDVILFSLDTSRVLGTWQRVMRGVGGYKRHAQVLYIEGAQHPIRHHLPGIPQGAHRSWLPNKWCMVMALMHAKPRLAHYSIAVVGRRAREDGAPGIVLVTSGPGATNLVTPLQVFKYSPCRYLLT